MPIQSRREATFDWVIGGLMVEKCGGFVFVVVVEIDDDDNGEEEEEEEEDDGGDDGGGVGGGGEDMWWKGSRMGDRADGTGGSGPPIVTLLTYPEFCSERRRVWSILVDGREVRPRRAAEAFWR